MIPAALSAFFLFLSGLLSIVSTGRIALWIGSREALMEEMFRNESTLCLSGG